MLIKCLIENTAVSDQCETEHGLSLYVETEKHHLLFDFGASAQFIQNAQLLGVDLSLIDLGILSHGHYDHGGGLKPFLSINEKAKICVSRNAFEKHYSERDNKKMVEIGIDESLIENERIYYSGNSFRIDTELLVFSDVEGSEFIPKGNALMAVESCEGILVPDEFLHEQNLIVNSNGKIILIAGCAHRGILNIVNRAAAHMGKMPDIVIGGFHLDSRILSYCETHDRIKELGEALLKTGAKYYTGHCTGKNGFEILTGVMGNRVEYLSTGQIINIE